MSTAFHFVTFSRWVLEFAAVLWIPAVSWLALGCVWPLIRQTDLTPPVGLWTLFIAPFAILLWGAFALGWAEGAHGGGRWSLWIANALALTQFALVTVQVRRYRHSLWFAVPTAAASAVFTVVALFVASMAITNDWL